MLLEGLRVVELVEDGDERAPVPVVRDAPAVVALARQVAQRDELHVLPTTYDVPFSIHQQQSASVGNR